MTTDHTSIDAPERRVDALERKRPSTPNVRNWRDQERLSVRQLAVIAGQPAEQIRVLIRSGEIGATKDRNRWWISKREVLAHLGECERLAPVVKPEVVEFLDRLERKAVAR